MEKAGANSNYMEVPIGFTLASRYIIESKISEGGMGVVYAAFDTKLRQTKAIKLLKKDMSQSKTIVSKLIQEAKMAMMLSHPGIMRLINFEQDGPYAFLLMEYVKGRTLKELAASQPDGKLSQELVGKIGYMICAALEYAHNKNVIHRDIKPANIIINDELDSIKLMDFGIAKILAPASEEQPQIAGTLFYIAPEVFNGAPPSPTVDIYALGLSLYELLAGSHPFYCSDSREVIDHHFKTTPPQLEGVDRALSNIIFQCVEKKPNARFQTAGALKRAFAKNLGLDEEANVTKMKTKVEADKRRVSHELRRIELEKERLENQRKDIERERKQPARMAQASTSSSSSVSITDTIENFSPALPLLALFIGGVAGIAGVLVAEGSALDFESVSSYGAASVMIVCAIAVAGPVLVNYTSLRALAGAVIGAILGYIGFSFGDAYVNYTVENAVWVPYNFVMYIATALPLAVGVGLIHVGTCEISKTVKITALAIVVALASSIFPYIGLAEGAFGLLDEKANYIYTPLMTGFVWAAAGFAGAGQD